MRDLFDGEIVEGSNDWIDREWDRMERENPTQTILGVGMRFVPHSPDPDFFCLS